MTQKTKDFLKNEERLTTLYYCMVLKVLSLERKRKRWPALKKEEKTWDLLAQASKYENLLRSTEMEA